MKCPSCGVWNRAHFTKCFRCGAELTDAAKPDTDIVEPEFFEDEEPVTAVLQPAQEPLPAPAAEEEDELEVYSLYDDGDWDDEDEDEEQAVYGAAAIKAAPVASEPVIAAPVAADADEDEEDEPVMPVYDDEDEDDEPETVYRAPVRTAAPAKVTPVEAEPVQEETRKFAPVVPDAADGATRKFAPVTTEEPAVIAQPAPVDAEPEVAPTQPGISHEIIHAIFTNPPATLNNEPIPEFVDEPRPRKLMSRTRRPIPETDEEPATVYKKRYDSNKPEPQVGTMADFKPTARLAAQLADERGDEYTAFASTERKLVAEVTERDPFEAAFDLPRVEKHAPVEVEEKTAEEPAAVETENDVTEETPVIPEDEAPAEIIVVKEEPAEAPAEAEAAEEPVVIPEEQPAPAAEAEEVQPEIEQPAWVKEALFNLGQPDVNALHTQSPAAPRRTRTLQDVQLGFADRKQEAPVMKEEEPISRSEHPRRSMGVQPMNDAPAAHTHSGMDAISRHDSQRTARPQQSMETIGFAPRRTAPQTARPQAAAPHAPVTPVAPSAPVRTAAPVRPAAAHTAPRTEDTFTSPRAARQPVERTAPKPQQPERRPEPAARPRSEQTFDLPQRPQARPRPSAAVRTETPAPAPRRAEPARQPERKPASSGGLKVQNLPRLIILCVAALLIFGLLLWGGISLLKGAIGLVKGFIGQQTEMPGDDLLAEEDPNAPVVTAGTVNGRPGHIITFKGNDNDIIYISNENLTNSYNVPIIGGTGTLELEDSELIGNRYVTDDVEIVLNPVLHEAGSGKETPLAPVTFTVTPPDAYLEIISPAGGTDATTLGSYQVKIRVEMGSQVTIGGSVVSDMIAEEENNLGSIVYNVSVEPTGDNSIPIVVQKEGCKSITKNIILTRPVMSVPIELDAATPSNASSSSITISGKVEAGVKVKVTSPTSGDVNMNSDGSFSFTAKLSTFGENEIVIVAEKGDDSSSLTHTINYTPSYNDYVEKAWAMDYEALSSYAGDYQPFKCTGKVVEVLADEPYTCIFNVGSDSNPKHIYLEMVPGKPLTENVKYHVYADTHADGTKDGYPYMMGRFYVEAR